MTKPNLTQQEIKNILNYDPETGIFTWKVNRGPHKTKGKLAGFKDAAGYSTIKINCIGYKAHRLAWIYMTGSWPKELIDHKNMDRFDNRWKNIREAKRYQNKLNSKVRKDSELGVKGVTKCKNLRTNPFCARIFINKKSVNIGFFPTVKQAKEAYDNMAKKIHGEFFNPG